MVETVDSTKLANLLNQKWGNVSPKDPLNVLIQVNTSGEEGKIIENVAIQTVLNKDSTFLM